MNLNTRVNLQPVSNEFKDYGEWLLKSKTNHTEELKPLEKDNRTGSFEFLDMEKGFFDKFFSFNDIFTTSPTSFLDYLTRIGVD